jgi:aminopeptidase YwaD
MKSIRTTFFTLIVALFLAAPAFSQTIQERFKEHITFLADDKLKGRDTGSEGEKMAADYLIKEFEAMGLKPAGENGTWLQPFDFVAERTPADESVLSIKGRTFSLSNGLLVFPQTGDAEFSGQMVQVGFGISAPQIGWDDYKGKTVEGKCVVIERGTPEPNNPHSKYAEFAPLASKIETAVKKGAAAIVFVNPKDSEMGEPILSFSQRVSREDIPVVWLKDVPAADLDGATANIRTALLIDRRTGNNVVASLDHGAEYTIVVGAHYDHLGYGSEGSLHRGEPAIHNGADDNASGTAMIVEMARALQDQPYKRFNYVFIAFSGEEKGLLGSNYYAKNPTIDLKKVSCMINFDMVGRLDPEQKTLAINGVGTSPTWNDLMGKMEIEDLKIKTTESGIGPSDHTSFYLKDIPVLHFFSGTHSDYHKPGDDEELINYDGMDQIFVYVMSLVGGLNEHGEKLEFTKTKAEESRAVPRWKVSLGVIPDYMFEGDGMRIDGITEGRPAANAGLKEGDVVVKMGDHEVTEMMSYMRALAKFEKGDKVKVTVMRKGKKKVKKVQF